MTHICMCVYSSKFNYLLNSWHSKLDTTAITTQNAAQQDRDWKYEREVKWISDQEMKEQKSICKLFEILKEKVETMEKRK